MLAPETIINKYEDKLREYALSKESMTDELFFIRAKKEIISIAELDTRNYLLGCLFAAYNRMDDAIKYFDISFSFNFQTPRYAKNYMVFLNYFGRDRKYSEVVFPIADRFFYSYEIVSDAVAQAIFHHDQARLEKYGNMLINIMSDHQKKNGAVEDIRERIKIVKDFTDNLSLSSDDLLEMKEIISEEIESRQLLVLSYSHDIKMGKKPDTFLIQILNRDDNDLISLINKNVSEKIKLSSQLKDKGLTCLFYPKERMVECNIDDLASKMDDEFFEMPNNLSFEAFCSFMESNS